MKVRELKERLGKIIDLGYGDFEVIINIVDEKGEQRVVPVDGFMHSLDPDEILRLYSKEEGDITKQPR